MDYNPVIGNNLRRIMADEGISAKDLASKVGISSTHLSYVVNSKRRPSFELLGTIADALGVTLAELVKRDVVFQESPAYDGPLSIVKEDFKAHHVNLETHPAGKLVKVPIIGTVTAGPNGLAYEDYTGEEIADTGLVNGGNLFYLRIKGDSMIGDGIFPGDLALVRETPEVEYGALAIIIVDGEEGTIKRVYKNGDSVTLLASNPKCPPRIFKKEEMSRVRIVGEVKMTMRSY